MAVSRQEFIEQLAVVLEEDPGDVNDQTKLADLEGWDSVGHLSVIACIDELFQKPVNVDQLRECETIGDIAERFGGESNDDA